MFILKITFHREIVFHLILPIRFVNKSMHANPHVEETDEFIKFSVYSIKDIPRSAEKYTIVIEISSLVCSKLYAAANITCFWILRNELIWRFTVTGKLLPS